MKKTVAFKQWITGFLKIVSLFIFCFSFSPCFAQATWTVIPTQAPDSSGSLMLLLSDGTVLCKTTNGGDRVGTLWNKLTPNSNGSYLNGTWSRVCPMKDSRLYFSSQMMKNGKLYIAGGEYGTGGTLGEIYDPVADSWTQLPNTNNYLGDACSAILEDGKILQASLASYNKVLVFNPATNTYSNGPNTLAGHNESTWLKLPDNSLLFADIGSTSTERYIPALNQWIVDAPSPSNLYDPYGYETGPAFLLPDGRAFFMGSLGNTAYYTPSGNNSPGTWTAGPVIPSNNGMPDAAGTMMVDGKIIFAAGPKPVSTNSLFLVPTYYYEFDYTNNSYTQLTAPGGGLSTLDTAFSTVMLNLPDGNMMLSRQSTKDYFIREPNGAPLAIGKPTISTVAQNGCTKTFTLTGLLFNGICEGSCFGDDWQMNTNFPIVRLTAGSAVYYARTYNWNHTGVRTGLLQDTVLFDLPPTIPSGTYSLSVSANGNSSNPITFTFAAFPALASLLRAPDICSGQSFTYNAIPNSGGTTLQWTRDAVSGISNPAISAAQTVNPNEVLLNTVAFSKTAVYSYTLTNGTCVTYNKVSVVVHPAPIITSTGNTSICENTSTTLTASGVLTYTWSTGAITKTVSLHPLATSVYTVSGHSLYSCLAAKQITVTVKPLPVLTVNGQSLICEGESIVLIATSSANNYMWNSGANTNTITVTPLLATSFSVTSIAAGCSSSAAITVSLQLCNDISNVSKIEHNFKIFPSPTKDFLILHCVSEKSEALLVNIYDLFGNLVVTSSVRFEIESNERAIDLSNLSSGVYLLTLRSDSEVFKTKVIKE